MSKQCCGNIVVEANVSEFVQKHFAFSTKCFLLCTLRKYFRKQCFPNNVSSFGHWSGNKIRSATDVITNFHHLDALYYKNHNAEWVH